MVLEGEEPRDDQSVSKDVLHEDEKVLSQNDQIAVDVQQDLSAGGLGISLSNDVKESSANDKGICNQQAKNHESEREEYRAILNNSLKATVQGSRPSLDLSVTPAGMNSVITTNT